MSSVHLTSNTELWFRMNHWGWNTPILDFRENGILIFLSVAKLISLPSSTITCESISACLHFWGFGRWDRARRKRLESFVLHAEPLQIFKSVACFAAAATQPVASWEPERSRSESQGAAAAQKSGSSRRKTCQCKMGTLCSTCACPRTLKVAHLNIFHI